MKDDERAMMLWLYAHPHESLIEYPMDEKRKAYVCLKWANKGWYDYGVTARSGWLEDKGKDVARGIQDA